jgi:hypothetical protein
LADKDPFQFPWASLAVVATLVSSTLLAPRAFDLLRPAEKDRAQALVSTELEVEARLWEDPFAATRRYEADRQQRCDKEAAARQKPTRDCMPAELTARRSAEHLRSQLDPDRDGTLGDALLMFVMVPGNAFVGAEEARRRTRYAVLSGLQAENYLPDNAEHIGLLTLDVAPQRPGDQQPAQDRLLLPYELLSPSRSQVGNPDFKVGAAASAASAASSTSPAPRAKRYTAVAVVWVDESALPVPKLDGLAQVLHEVAGTCTQCPKVAVIGPSTSDDLRSALRLIETRAADAKTRARFGVADLTAAQRAGYRLLSQAAVFNSSATVSDDALVELHGQSLETWARRQLDHILDVRPPGGVASILTLQRTIASDGQILPALRDELAARLPTDGSRRVVLVTESDSIYARHLERQFSHLIQHWRGGIGNEDRVYFFRGVDGVTVRDGVERAAPVKADPATAIEWPESRDQLDYLRRMADSLKRSESLTVPKGAPQVGGTGRIGAIGIFANDVHDKLLILQALHDSFPDKVFFTTDMDARFLHPRTLPFTRNLVVASSLPLRFLPQLTAPGQSAASHARSLQTGTPPLRDVYQASVFLAARLAACQPPCADIQAQAQAVIASPSIYEIGRDRAIPVAGFSASPKVPHESSSTYQGGFAAFLSVMALGLLMWPSTPALRRARDAVLGIGEAAGGQDTGYSRLAMIFALVYAGLFACTVGSAVEALRPGSLGPRGVLAWGGLAVLASLVMYPGARAFGVTGSWRHGPRWQLALGLVLLLGLAGGALALLKPGGPLSAGEPLAWLQGVSGWPSHLLNMLALVCGVATLDRLWSGIDEARKADEDWLGLTGSARTDVGLAADGAQAPHEGAGAVHRVGRWMLQHTLLGWRQPPGSGVPFAAVWRGYQQRGAALPRGMRVAFWTLFTAASAGFLFWALSDQQLPEVPVRTVGHRQLVTLAYDATLLLLPLVVVAVADATMLAWRFLRMLGAERTVYAPATVRRFAAALGSVQVDVWMRPLAADPADRRANNPLADADGHTLLDDWIDIQVIARRTRAVAPLVVAPFVMLALMVVARSRLFDNWAISWPIAAAAGLYVLWLGALALLLKQAAEACRDSALARMNADLRWMAGADDASKALVEPMKRLIAAVEAERSGAFAPPLDQPFFKGLLVPLGGAGGAQLFERLLLAN